MKKGTYEDHYLIAETYEELVAVFNELDKLYQITRERMKRAKHDYRILKESYDRDIEQAVRTGNYQLRNSQAMVDQLEQEIVKLQITLEERDNTVEMFKGMLEGRISGWLGKK